MTDKLNPNDDLVVIGSITSQNGQSTLVMQGDGNLVLFRSGGKTRWATGTSDHTVSQAIMQGDGNFVMYGPGGAYIWDTGTDGHPGAYLIVQDDGNVVIYDPSGNPLWATNTNMICRDVTGFLPSTSGFHFPNNFPKGVPLINIDVLGQQIPIGDASKGLCGGMAFAARDYFEAGISIPPDTTVPSSGPLFDFLVRRLFDSFNLYLPPPPLPIPPFKFFAPLPPFGPGPATYAWLMNPDLPDHETVASNVGLSPRGRAWIMINDEWPKIKADIDSGRLSPLGLNRIKSPDLLQMGDGNHQVLAYGYCLDDTDLAIRIYDPNHENDDTITLSLSIADPQHTTPVTYSADVDPVWCFFQPIYIFSFPPGGVQSQSNWRWCHKCQGLFFSGGRSSIGRCPAGGRHERGVSGNYTLAHNSPVVLGQPDWRWCHKCQGLFFSGGQSSVGSCPAGGQHEKGVSGNYNLAHNSPLAPGQSDWRWCHKCQGLFFSGGQSSVGSCPAGGQHEKGVSGMYTLAHIPSRVKANL
jgi:hypothetical protein